MQGINQSSNFVLPKWLLESGILDTAAGIENCGGKEEYLGIIIRFFETLEEKANEIESFYNSGDIKKYTIKVHALKSSARIIGAADLSEKARLLEAAGNENDIEYIKENTGELLKDYRALGNIYVSDNKDDEKENLPEKAFDMLVDAYSGISEFSEAMD